MYFFLFLMTNRTSVHWRISGSNPDFYWVKKRNKTKPIVKYKRSHGGIKSLSSRHLVDLLGSLQRRGPRAALVTSQQASLTARHGDACWRLPDGIWVRAPNVRAVCDFCLTHRLGELSRHTVHYKGKAITNHERLFLETRLRWTMNVNKNHFLK